MVCIYLTHIHAYSFAVLCVLLLGSSQSQADIPLRLLRSSSSPSTRFCIEKTRSPVLASEPALRGRLPFTPTGLQSLERNMCLDVYHAAVPRFTSFTPFRLGISLVCDGFESCALFVNETPVIAGARRWRRPTFRQQVSSRNVVLAVLI